MTVITASLLTSLSVIVPSSAPPPPNSETLSLHDALPIYRGGAVDEASLAPGIPVQVGSLESWPCPPVPWLPPLRGVCPSGTDRKSTRLNSSHVAISYAVFCLKNKNVNGAPLSVSIRTRFS